MACSALQLISTQCATVDVVPFELADLANVLLRRHRLQIVDEARVDVRVEVYVLGLVRGALRRVVLADPEPCVSGRSVSSLRVAAMA